MKRTGRAFTAAVVAGAVWIGLATTLVAQPPVRIGAAVAQTGLNAALGQVQLRGYQLCVKHVDEKGGVLGRKLELVLYDDGSNPTTAVRLLRTAHHAGQGQARPTSWRS